MNAKLVNINSKSDCEMLIGRIRGTLQATNPVLLSTIRVASSQFHKDDRYIFEQLCKAILSIQAVYGDIQSNLPKIKGILFNYNISQVASLSDNDITKMYNSNFRPLNIRARFLKKELTCIRNNAMTFGDIQQKSGSVWELIEQCIKDKGQDGLMKSFIGSGSQFKLDGVGLAVCCEFFNNIGIDEFKPDTHTSRFFKRIGVAKKSDRPKEIRKIGITIAQSLGQPRKYVDSHIWNFCAEGRGAICTEVNPKCHLCTLRIQEPMLCNGIKIPS